MTRSSSTPCAAALLRWDDTHINSLGRCLTLRVYGSTLMLYRLRMLDGGLRSPGTGFDVTTLLQSEDESSVSDDDLAGAEAGQNVLLINGHGIMCMRHGGWEAVPRRRNRSQPPDCRSALHLVRGVETATYRRTRWRCNCRSRISRYSEAVASL